MKTVMVSGGFDPLHVGHVRYLRAAASLGDILVVALNSDEWLTRKKGRPFQAWAERAEILMSQRVVDSVIEAEDADGTVSETLRLRRPDIFAKGGDRGAGNTPETAVCAELGIAVHYGVGGDDKPQSSSRLLARWGGPPVSINRPWGHYEVLIGADDYKVKRLVLNPGAAISLQKHQRRAEHWIPLDRANVRVGDELWVARGDSYIYVPRGEVHQLGNPNALPLEVIEVQRGECDESDIIRTRESGRAGERESAQ